MKTIIPYLSIDDATSLIEFYHKVFGAELHYKTLYGEMPVEDGDDMEITDDIKDKIAFAKINFPNGQSIYMSDVFPGMPDMAGTKLSLHAGYENEDELRRVFESLSEGGEVQMPLSKTFWAPLYGNVRDKFGIEWSLELLDDQDNPWD